MRINTIGALGGALLALCAAAQATRAAPTLGLFQGESDVGTVAPPGTATYDSTLDRYTLTSAGANTWYHLDAFHYLWIDTSGDWTLTADIDFAPPSYGHPPNPHRKGILMFRQSLTAGSAYVALAVHGSGLTALQFRGERGANTEDSEIDGDLPKTIRIEKRGDEFTAFLSVRGEPLHPVGASTRLHLASPYYLGLGALSHDVDTTDQVRFTHVTLTRPRAATGIHPVTYSTVETIQIEDQYRRASVLRSVPAKLRSVNWIAGGKFLYVDEDGRLERIATQDPPVGTAPQPVSTGKLDDCSGNYGLSPDGKWLAISCRPNARDAAQVYVLPADGGDPARAVTSGAVGSYFHAWSPDSRMIAFTRGSASKADIFTIPAMGGVESQLTTDTVNDGPDFSPDGKYIYFDSARSGMLQIWRMHVDGSAPEQITDDDHQNSSPHVSPDGKHLAFLSQPPQAGLGISDAALRVMAFEDGLIRTVVEFEGNRDSFAMYSWGDTNHLGFVSYQSVP